MATILADGPVSYYQQLYTILRDELTRGEWKPGDRMPSETELITIYGVSRITVRQAFDLLVNDGFVYRRRGSGTFVTTRSSDSSLNRILSFTEDMEQRGLRPETRLIAARLEPAAADVARKLGIEPGEELAVLESLCLADDAPMGMERSHLGHRHCPGVLEEDYTRALAAQDAAGTVWHPTCPRRSVYSGGGGRRENGRCFVRVARGAAVLYRAGLLPADRRPR